jgi:hypothetical protein
MKLHGRVDAEPESLEHVPLHIKQLLLGELVVTGLLQKSPHANRFHVFELGTD